jgi:hypothetical protein
LQKGSSLADVLSRCQVFAERMVDLVVAEYRHPRDELYEDVLDCWFDAGGRLSKSRVNPAYPNAGTLGGPTIRYLQAVLIPVMRDKAPKPEGLRKVIDKFAVRMENILLSEEEMVLRTEAIRNGNDPESAIAHLSEARRRGIRAKHISSRHARSLVRGRGRS